jgi:hypothetical protein
MALALSCGALLCAPDAQAVLGAGADTIQADQIRLRGVTSQRKAWQMTTHEISLSDGSSIKEYVNASGLVFAVSWHTRLKPQLHALLGSQYGAAVATPTAASGVSSMKRQQTTRQPDLVLRQGGRMNAFSGLAYIPTLVPNGVNADALR